MAQETNTIKTVIEIDARGSEQSLKNLERTIENTVKSVDALHKTEAQVQIILNSTTESFNRQTRTLNNLEKRYAPISAEVRKLQKDQAYLNSVIEKGGTNSDRAAELLGKVSDRLDNMSNSAKDAGADLNRFQQFAGQAGYQVADLANQIAIGHNAFLAFGMQAGQLIGVMGPMGAVIGAVVTVLGVVTAAFLDSQESMKSAGEEAGVFGTSLQALQKITSDYNDAVRSISSAQAETEAAFERLRKQVYQTRTEYEYFKGSFGGPTTFLDKFELAIRNTVDTLKESKSVGFFSDILVASVDGAKEKAERLKEEMIKSEADLSKALSLEEKKRNILINQYLEEQRDERQKNIDLMKFEGEEREKQTKIIEAQEKVTKDLMGLGASQSVIDEERKKAADHAASIFESTKQTEKLIGKNKELSEALKEVNRWEVEHQELIQKTASTDRSTQKMIDDLREEAYQLSLNSKERFVRNALIRAENEYKQNGIPIDQERIKAIREEAEALYDLRKYYDDKKKADDDAANQRKRQLDDETRSQQEMINNVTKYGADKITDGLMNSMKGGWSKALDTMFNDFQSFLVRAAAEAALKPLATAMFGGQGSFGKDFAGSSIGQFLGLSTQSGEMTGLGASFTDSLKFLPYGALGSVGAQSLGLGGTNKFVNLAGGLGGSIGGAMAGSALAGSSLGMALGLTGAVMGPVGAILGGIAGTALGGLFGSGPKSYGSNAYVGMQNGQAFLSGSDSFRGGDITKSRNVAIGYVQALNDLSSKMGGTLNYNPVTRFKADEKYGEYQVIGVGSFKTGEEALQAALGATLRNPDLWSGLTEDIRQAMRNSKGDIAKLGEDIDFAMSFRDALKQISGDVSESLKKAKDQAKQMMSQYNEMSSKVKELGLDLDATNKAFESSLRITLGLKEAQPVLSEVGQSIEFVKAQFQELQPLIEKFGITAAEASAGLNKKLLDLRLQFEADIATQIKAIIDPVGLQLDNLSAIQEQRLKDAQSLGADILAVEKLNSLERIKVLEQEGANIRAWLDKQILGQTSSLNGADKLSVAQQMFGSAIEGARNGNYSDVANLTTLADAVIESARAMYASSENYSFLETMVRSQLESVGKTLGLKGFAGGTLSAPSGLALVGERGAELVNFRGGESIYTSQQTGSILSASSSDSKAMAKMIAELVAETRQLRQQNEELVESQSKLNNKLSLVLSQSSSSKVAS